MKSDVTCTRRLEIDAGHRLMKHGGKCQNTHGHRYAFELTCAPITGLDEVGRVIDFAEVKNIVGTWLDEKWDHGFIHEHGDPIGEAVKAAGQKTYGMPCPPTAENLAAYLHGRAHVWLSAVGIRVLRVRCYETPNCWADSVRTA